MADADAVRAHLFERRIVLVSGVLDDTAASEVAASLMALDALGDEHVELRLSSVRADLSGALVLIDVIEVLGVPVHTSGVGVLSGGAVGVLAAGARRALAPRSRLELRLPEVAVAGTAAEISRQLAANAAACDSFFDSLARACRRERTDVAAQWKVCRVLEAADACTLGYADLVGAR